MKVYFTERQVAEIVAELAQQLPERLLHLIGRMHADGSLQITTMVVDDDAEASDVSVVASARAQDQINSVERKTGDSLLGIIHSHPRAVPEPSGQDAVAIADVLSINPVMQHALVGVVTDVHSLPADAEHVLRMEHGQLALHSMSRGGTNLTPATPALVDPTIAFMAAASARQPLSAVRALSGRRIMVVGAGSLGSTVAEQLVRNGVPEIILVDDDEVEAVNLTRTVYTCEDIGIPKTEALARRLTAINPALAVDTMTTKVDRASEAELLALVRDCDCVVAVTDDPQAQGLIDSLLFEAQCPGVFGAVYKGADSGEICFVVPGMTACYRCAVGPRMNASLLPGMDYSTGRVQGAVALGADIAHIATMTAKVTLAIIGLISGEDRWLQQPLVDGKTFIQVGMQPQSFEDIGAFDETPAQHAWQTLWLRPEGGDDCIDCVIAPPAPSPSGARRHIIRRPSIVPLRRQVYPRRLRRALVRPNP